MHTACSAQRLEKQPVLFCSVLYLPKILGLGAVPTLHQADNTGTTFFLKSQQRRSHSVPRYWGSKCASQLGNSETSQFHCPYAVTGTHWLKIAWEKASYNFYVPEFSWRPPFHDLAHQESNVIQIHHVLIYLYLPTTTGFSWLSGELRSLEQSSFQTHGMLS